MAVSTAGTVLKSSETQNGTYTKVVDIISYPDLGSTPSKLDTTDLSATKYKTSILGLQEAPDLIFECNYDKEAYLNISAMTTPRYFRLEFGENGEDGIISWHGQISVYINGGGVDEVRRMTVVCSADTPLVLS